MKKITIGIPAYKATEHIVDLLNSIKVQSILPEINVIICNDEPGVSYDFVIDMFPMIDIKIINNEKNVGPGLAREYCVKACETPWITLVDADDLLFSPFSIEDFRVDDHDINNCLMIQSVFLEMHRKVNETTGNLYTDVIRHDSISHPWVFGRMYNVQKLKEFNIHFTELRAMEDAEFNWKVRTMSEYGAYLIHNIDVATYIWRDVNMSSITKTRESSDDKPIYNYDLCFAGFAAATCELYRWCKQQRIPITSYKEPLISRFISSYTTWLECIQEKPVFAEQVFFFTKKIYNEVIKPMLKEITWEELMENCASDLLNVHPPLKLQLFIDNPLKDFLEKLDTEPYGHRYEMNIIRKKYSNEILENDTSFKVLDSHYFD